MAQIKQLIIKIIKTKIQSSKQLPNITQKKKRHNNHQNRTSYKKIYIQITNP